MTGPEHYREAERLLEIASPLLADDSPNIPEHAAWLAEAQVHATLALAAAAALNSGKWGLQPIDETQWRSAAGVPR